MMSATFIVRALRAGGRIRSALASNSNINSSQCSLQTLRSLSSLAPLSSLNGLPRCATLTTIAVPQSLPLPSSSSLLLHAQRVFSSSDGSNSGSGSRSGGGDDGKQQGSSSLQDKGSTSSTRGRRAVSVRSRQGATMSKDGSNSSSGSKSGSGSLGRSRSGVNSGSSNNRKRSKDPNACPECGHPLRYIPKGGRTLAACAMCSHFFYIDRTARNAIDPNGQQQQPPPGHGGVRHPSEGAGTSSNNPHFQFASSPQIIQATPRPGAPQQQQQQQYQQPPAFGDSPFAYNGATVNNTIGGSGGRQQQHPPPQNQQSQSQPFGRQPDDARYMWSETTPKPKQIIDLLNRYVIGQDEAKTNLAVAVYNHYKRVSANLREPTSEVAHHVTFEKSNILMVGPTGCGKTLLARTLAEILDVPFAISDCTTLTQAGYVGDDVDSVLHRLIQAANYNIAAAERGIVFLDEIDKIASLPGRGVATRDVSGEGVQQGLLKILEGTVVNVGESKRKAPSRGEPLKINTSNILFIASGAFTSLESIIKTRREKSSIGFNADIASPEEPRDGELLQHVTSDDLVKFGLIPEFVGRFPCVVALNQLTEEDLMRVLTEPKDSLVAQFKALFKMDGSDLVFDESGLKAIAKQASEKRTGARGLRSFVEEVLRDPMIEIASENIASVIISDQTIAKKEKPLYVYGRDETEDEGDGDDSDDVDASASDARGHDDDSKSTSGGPDNNNGDGDGGDGDGDSDGDQEEITRAASN